MLRALQATAPPKPEWQLLHWFFWSALGSIVLLAFSYFMWWLRSTRPRPNFLATLLHAIPEQQPGWSFKDSWASNVGIAAAIFSGFFGSTSTLKDVFGTDQANSVGAIIAVAAAVGTALVLAAPLILFVTATRAGQDRVLGFLIAATATSTGIAGQVVVTVKAGESLNFGGYQHYLPWVGVVVLGLLAAYIFRSVSRVLTGAHEAMARSARNMAPRLKSTFPEIRFDTPGVANFLMTTVPDMTSETAVPPRTRSHVL